MCGFPFPDCLPLLPSPLLPSPLLPSSLALLSQVADFGLSTQITQMETHVSSMFQGTLTHMVRRIFCSLSIIHSVKETYTAL